jgi:hypothetical protein
MKLILISLCFLCTASASEYQKHLSEYLIHMEKHRPSIKNSAQFSNNYYANSHVGLNLKLPKFHINQSANTILLSSPVLAEITHPIGIVEVGFYLNLTDFADFSAYAEKINYNPRSRSPKYHISNSTISSTDKLLITQLKHKSTTNQSSKYQYLFFFPTNIEFICYFKLPPLAKDISLNNLKAMFAELTTAP